MKKFAVKIVETYTQVVEVLAEDEDAAVSRAEELVEDGVIQPEVDYDDYGRDCAVVEMRINQSYPTLSFE